MNKGVAEGDVMSVEEESFSWTSMTDLLLLLGYAGGLLLVLPQLFSPSLLLVVGSLRLHLQVAVLLLFCAAGWSIGGKLPMLGQFRLVSLLAVGLSPFIGLCFFSRHWYLSLNGYLGVYFGIECLRLSLILLHRRLSSFGWRKAGVVCKVLYWWMLILLNGCFLAHLVVLCRLEGMSRLPLFIEVASVMQSGTLWVMRSFFAAVMLTGVVLTGACLRHGGRDAKEAGQVEPDASSKTGAEDVDGADYGA